MWEGSLCSKIRHKCSSAVLGVTMLWSNEEDYEEEEDLLFSPALMARRASESWITAPPVEVEMVIYNFS